MDLVSNENKSLKNYLSSHICHIPIASSSIDKHVACSTSSSIIKNDICALKKSVDCLGSTLSQCAMNHKKLEFIFHKKHASHIMHIIHGIHLMYTMITPILICMLECTHVHIATAKAILQDFILID